MRPALCALPVFPYELEITGTDEYILAQVLSSRIGKGLSGPTSRVSER